MSLRALWDVVIHLNSFKNIAIRKPCICIIMLRVYYLEGGRKIFSKVKQLPQLNLSKSDDSNRCIYQEPMVSKSPPFYQSSLFSVKHSNDVLNLNETISFQLEVEIVPDTLRKFTKFDELYSFIGREFFICADLYTKSYKFDDGSDDESEYEYLKEFDISRLK